MTRAPLGITDDVVRTLALAESVCIRPVLRRVTEPEHVALTLGQGARDRGATADLIDDATPGVAYIGQDGVPEAARVRFTHVTDDDITALAEQYAARTRTRCPVRSRRWPDAHPRPAGTPATLRPRRRVDAAGQLPGTAGPALDGRRAPG